MRKRFFSLLVSIFFCLLCFFSNATSLSPTINVTHVVAPVNQLSISDIDFKHSTTPKWLFTINISVTGIPSLWVRMNVEAGFQLPGGESYPNTVTFGTDSFLVNGMRSVSNLDLGRTIMFTDYDINSVARRRLEETALATGQVPAGIYSFHIRVTATNGSASANAPPMIIVVSNPSTVELVSPSDGDQFVNQFPVFQWQYDGPSSRISIYEKLPGQSSLEQAASGVPHLSLVNTTSSLRYPSSGARILEQGKTYVWFVEGLSGAAGGTTVSHKSSLRSFTVASNGTESLSSLLDELARTLPQYQALFDELKAQGFTAGGTIRLNGAAISISELQKLLNNLRLHPDAVTLVESE